MSNPISALRPSTQATPLDFPPTPTAATPSLPALSAEQRYQQLATRNAPPPNLRGLTLERAGNAALTPMAHVPTAAQKQMDAVMDAFAGPYDVPGEPKPVHAQVYFHSNHPLNNPKGSAAPKRVVATVIQDLNRHAKPTINANNVLAARGTPDEVRKVTQAMIDAGHLPSGPGSVAERIRLMQNQFYLGVDCIGFVMANVGGKGDRSGGCENYLLASGRFSRAPGGLSAMASAKPGDALHLTPDAEGRQHNVMIYSNDVIAANDPRRASLARMTPEHGSNAKVGALNEGGPLRIFEIRCSGGGQVERGVRRELWFHNESNDTWGVTIPGSKEIFMSTKGPDGHPSGVLFSRRGQ